MQGQFKAELGGIVLECRPERITVIYCDAKVQGVEEYESPEDFDLQETKPKGGGGTKNCCCAF